MLTKTQTVMEFDLVDSGHVYFSSKDDDTSDRLRGFNMEENDWNDMGSPLEITVTVEPGDRLND